MQEIEFNDEFDKEEPDICSICGSESETLVGYNEEKDMCKYECRNCGAIVICDSDGIYTTIKGEPRNWEDFLSKNLSFPFNGVIDENQETGFFEENGSLRYGDKIVVEKVRMEDDLCGVIVDIKKGRNKYSFPICDVAVEDKKSPNYKIVDDYRTWFANCR